MFSRDLAPSRPINVTFDYLESRRGIAPEESHCFAGRLAPRTIPLALRLTAEGGARWAQELLAAER